MSKELITQATRNLVAKHGRRIIGRALLTRGDGTGTLVADQASRLAFYHGATAAGISANGMAYLHPTSNVIFQNNISYESIWVDIGYMENDNSLYLLGQNASGVQADGGVTIIERTVNQQTQPSQAQFADLLVQPLATPTTEVYVMPGNYVKKADSSRQRFPGDQTTDLSAALGSIGPGSHQIAWVCLDTGGGTLISQFGSITAAINALPSPYDFSDSDILGISIGTAYKPDVPVYLYYGQTTSGIVETDILRQYDWRLIS